MKDSEIRPVSQERWHEAQKAELEFWEGVRKDGYGGLSYSRWKQYDPIWAAWDYTVNLGYDLDFFKDKTVVAIGCGPRGLISKLRAKEKIGVDSLISEYVKSFDLAKDVQYIAATGEALPLRGGYADVIFCINVLDHVLDPISLLREARRVLKDEGLFILQLNLTSSYAVADGMPSENDLPHPHHFSVSDVSEMLNQVGFKKERMIIKSESQPYNQPVPVSFTGVLCKSKEGTHSVSIPRRVCLLPAPSKQLGGVNRILNNLWKYLPRFGWEPTENPFIADIIHGHALCRSAHLDVYTNHGVYPVQERMPPWMRDANRQISHSFKLADVITTVSKWTANQWSWWEGIAPLIIPNFIDLEEWDNVPAGQFQIDGLKRPFCLWSKLEPYRGLGETLELAKRNSQLGFAITVVPAEFRASENVKVTGVMPLERMKTALKDCAVYLSLSTIDNFPFQILEAMALRKPILSYAVGGIPEAIRHKQEGYLVPVGASMDEIQAGLEYCFEHAEELGQAARKRLEEKFTVEKVVPLYIRAYEMALERRERRAHAPKCSIVITTCDFEPYVKECIDSALAQDFHSFEVIVIDDHSEDGTWELIGSYNDRVRKFQFEERGGKIHGIVRSRNKGVEMARGEFVSCLDGDDRIRPDFLSKLAPLLEGNEARGIAYSDFELFGDSKGVIRCHDFDFELLKKGNFIPCCNLFRKKAWERVGGCKPVGESWEDYNTWLTFTERGWGAKRYPEPLYSYRKKGEEGRDWESQPYVQRLRAVVNAYHSMILPPEVSVIIPCYDHEKYLKEAIDSVFAQTHQDFEIIVVNDGSPGDPKAITEEYWDPRLKLIEQENQGLSAARNAGIAAASGRYILPLDADDRLDPTFLEKAAKVQQDKGGKVAVYSDFVAFWDDGKRSEQQLEDYDFSELLKHALMPCTILYPRTVWAKVGGYKPEMAHGYEDWEFAISLGEQGCFGARIQEYLFHYRQHADTSMRKIMEADDKMLAREAKAIIQKLHRATYMKGPLPQEVKEKPRAGSVRLKYIGKKDWTVSYTVLGRRYDVSINKPFIIVPSEAVKKLLKLHFVEA